jgi:hypothetical protein
MMGDTLGVDRKTEVIRGVAVMELGDISDQDARKQFADSITFSQFMKLANGRKGIKARFTHPDMSSDGLGTYLGRWNNARIDGKKVRADLNISPRSHDSPKLGDVGKYVLDLAESDPDMFGASMATMLDEEAMKEAERDDGYQPIRLKNLFAIDVVDSPALTNGGLFSTSDDIPGHVSELLDSHFAGVQQSEIRERALGYLDRYLTNRYGVQPMSETKTTPAAVTQETIDAAIDKALGLAADKFGTLIDERITKALKENAQPPKPSDVELERKRCSDLFATAKNAGLEGYEKVAQEAIDKLLSVDSFKASITDRLIAQNGLTKDTGEQPSDPEAKYKKEYAAQRAAYTMMGLTEAEYITSRKIDDGSELLAPTKAA